jgi:F-type H+-transporting ATPase subunit delta
VALFFFSNSGPLQRLRVYDRYRTPLAGRVRKIPFTRAAFSGSGRRRRGPFIGYGVVHLAAQHSGTAGLAARYAAALFELADEAKQLDSVAADLKTVKAMIEGSGDLRRLVRSPVLTRAQQGGALAAVLQQAGIGELVRRFAALVAHNRRLFALVDMIDAYLADLARRRGEVTATVTSATALSETQTAAITEALRRAVGGKVAVELKTDASLIGGLVVKVGSRMIDSSLKSKLQRLQLAMKGVG